MPKEIMADHLSAAAGASTSSSSASTSSTAEKPPSRHRHMQVLDELELKARRCCSVSAAGSGAPAEGSAGDAAETQWTLADDAKLATYVQEFSEHIQRRAEEVATAVVELEAKSAKAAVQVELAKSAFLRLPDVRFVEQVVVDSDGRQDHDDDEGAIVNGHGPQSDTAPENDEEEDDANQLEAQQRHQQELEEQAIKDGMKALSLFYDPAAGGETDHYFGLDPVDDSACYYESAPADTFNQRPLPFIVGSKEFMESTDAGLGDDYLEDDDKVEEMVAERAEGGMSGSFLLDTSGIEQEGDGEKDEAASGAVAER
mmetsp:Transcript_25331/g.54831  ORF Transcript_25331/g.54831 Transcript_25331/m.54831 type:complete len:314 (+) Transcript_25331:59-1000(+)